MTGSLHDLAECHSGVTGDVNRECDTSRDEYFELPLLAVHQALDLHPIAISAFSGLFRKVHDFYGIGAFPDGNLLTGGQVKNKHRCVVTSNLTVGRFTQLKFCIGRALAAVRHPRILSAFSDIEVWGRVL